MFEGFGKYLRHAIAALMAALVGYIVKALATQGVEVPSDVALGAITFLSFVAYAFVEKFLRRFSWLDMEGFAMRQEEKQKAFTLRADLLAEKRTKAMTRL